jgi:voltage-gated potassium channel
MNKNARQSYWLFRELVKRFQKHEVSSLLYIFILTISIGTAFYYYVEQWRFIDSLYFSVSALTTVGFGDFHPTTDMSKLFTIIYELIGIGIVLGFIDAISHYTKRAGRKNDRSPSPKRRSNKRKRNTK